MKSKKFCAAFCVALTVIFASHCLSSCSLIPGYTEPEEQAIVSAIGFDVASDSVRVTVGISEEGGKQSRTLTGEGESIEEAVSYISASETSTLEVAHLAIIVLGRGIDSSWFGKIMDFCDRNEEISIAAQLVSCSDAEALLSADGASGYDISGAISSRREGSSVGAEARLYQVKGAILSSDPVFALPYFVTDGGAFELMGVRIYRGGEALAVLDRNETAYYMMMRSLFDRGILGGDAPGLSGSVGISECKTKYEFKRDGDAVLLTVRCSVVLDSELASDEYAEEILQAAAKNMEKLYIELSSRHGDVFGFSSAAAREGIESDRLFESLVVSFECEERG